MSAALKPAVHKYGSRRLRKDSGVALVTVAVGMVSLLAMLVIALDVVNLYVSSDQAQKSADAAALAGAEAFVTSGRTTNPSGVPLNSVCNGGTGDADLRAQALAAQNPVAGLASNTVTTSCPTTAPDGNPHIQVTVAQPGIGTFFSRIWGHRVSSVSATAVAEAYNPSFDPAGPPSAPIAIHGVKPWAVANCDTPAACASAPLFFSSNYAIVNGGSFVGQTLKLRLMDPSLSPSSQAPPPPAVPCTGPPAPGCTALFYALDGPAPLSCPSSAAVSCNQIGTGPPGLNYHDNIACEGSFVFSNGQQIGPGQPIQVDTRSFGNLQQRTLNGTECLIHAAGPGPGQGQDIFTAGPPVTITGGSQNPNPALRTVAGIHRSDSVVTVPVFNCPSAGTCDGTAQLPIVGFLQLGIQDVNASGDVTTVILNAAGVDPAITGTPVIGAGASPIPVRLIHP
jgi:hypothetical protein